MEEKRPNLKNIVSIIMISVTAILITITGIITKQDILRITPLYVSLFVGILQSRANRYANLIGGINSILYAVVYFLFGLYAYAASALLISCPFQIATFIRWTKHSYKHSTKFKELSSRQRAILASVFIASFIGAYIVLSALGSNYRLLDLSISLISVFTSVLTLLSFVEYSWLMLGTGVCSIALDLTMMKDYPSQITYLVFSVYSMICIIMQFISVRKLYKEQKEGTAK